MPIYCYRCEKCDWRGEKMFPLEKRRASLKCANCGHEAERDYPAECKGKRPIAGWPIYSDAVGVHPSQVQEATKDAREKGVPTDFTPDGRVIFTSRGHRKRYCEAYGFYDRSGGYGDPQKRR